MIVPNIDPRSYNKYPQISAVKRLQSDAWKKVTAGARYLFRGNNERHQ